jgi:HSP20 family protein
MIIIKFANVRSVRPDETIGEDATSYLSGIVNWQLASGIKAWNPPFDVLETNDDFIVRVEIAGMQEEDFDVTFDDPLVTIKGRRQDEIEFCTYHQMEIPFGEFSFQVEVPGRVVIDQISGEYSNGFLKIILPKARRKSFSLANNEEAED